MRKEKLAHELNCIKMCESDKAIERRIESIFSDGVILGWKEAGQCPKCLKDLPEEPINCPYCEENLK